MPLTFDCLDARRSTPSRQLTAPGPDEGTLLRMLQAAVRVPDHGKRVPFRFVRIAGPARVAIGESLVSRLLERDPGASAGQIDKERHRFSHAPLVIVVVARLGADEKIPESERFATAACVCFALLQAAQAAGFGAQWLTGWPAYDGAVLRMVGLGVDEQIAGFIHIGTPLLDAPERDRPDASGLLTDWDAAMIPAAMPAQAHSTRPTLYLVDASLYVFRAWHSMPDEFRDAEGWPTNAVHGFARFLLELLERERPSHIAIAFDEALDSCFRNALYPAYKANRDPAPEQLRRQFGQCKALCAALGLLVLAHSEYEADDLIGSALHLARARGFRGLILSADKDLSQLLEGLDEQWDYARGQRWDAGGVKARHGVHAHQIADYLALCGDSVDNIPGVPGIGAKTAAVLLAHFDSLDGLLARIDEVPYLRFRGAAQAAGKLRMHRDQALLCRQLSRIALDAPLQETGDFGRIAVEGDTLRALCDRVGFGPLTRRRLHEVVGLPFVPA